MPALERPNFLRSAPCPGMAVGTRAAAARRMESHGTPGRIQITRATYELLADEFECEPRGTIVVKGKGEVEEWYVIGLRDGPVLSQP